MAHEAQVARVAQVAQVAQEAQVAHVDDGAKARCARGRGARRGPQGVDAGELPARVPRRAERGDPRALRRRVVYDQRGRS